MVAIPRHATPRHADPAISMKVRDCGRGGHRWLVYSSLLLSEAMETDLCGTLYTQSQP